MSTAETPGEAREPLVIKSNVTVRLEDLVWLRDFAEEERQKAAHAKQLLDSARALADSEVFHDYEGRKLLDEVAGRFEGSLPRENVYLTRTQFARDLTAEFDTSHPGINFCWPDGVILDSGQAIIVGPGEDGTPEDEDEYTPLESFAFLLDLSSTTQEVEIVLVPGDDQRGAARALIEMQFPAGDSPAAPEQPPV